MISEAKWALYDNIHSIVGYVCVCSVVSDCLQPHGLKLPGSSVHGIFQAKVLEWVPYPPPGDLPDPGVEPESSASPALAGGFFTPAPPGKPHFGLCGMSVHNLMPSS